MVGLRAQAERDPGVSEVRGYGLMIGTELVDPATGTPDAARVAAIQRHCLHDGGLILMNAGTDGNVLRWMPPLVVTPDEIDLGLEVFAKALAATSP